MNTERLPKILFADFKKRPLNDAGEISCLLIWQPCESRTSGMKYVKISLICVQVV